MSFSLIINKWAEKSKRDIDQIRRAVILDLFNSVVYDTPVLDGRLRGNWIISVDQPSSETVDITDPTGQKTTSDIAYFVAGLKPGDQKVYLSNNLPYAYRIEFGYSKVKAPEGMVRKNFARVTDKLERRLP